MKVFGSIQERKEAVFIMKFLASLLFVSILLIKTGKQFKYRDFALGVFFRSYKVSLNFV